MTAQTQSAKSAENSSSKTKPGRQKPKRREPQREVQTMKITDIVSGKYKVPDSEMRQWIVEGKNTAVLDDVLCEELVRKFDIFIMGSIFWYYEDGVFRPDRSGSVIKTLIKMHIPQHTRRDNTVSRIYRLLLSNANLETCAEDVNKHPSHWINTQSGMFDVLRWENLPHDPKYKSINQIPHHFDGHEPPRNDGELIQSFLNQALPDKADQTTIFEMVGESCSVDCRYQKSIVLQGQGSTGKSTLLNVVAAAVGPENISGVPLQKLENRFYPVQLIGKLVNICTDLPSARMEFSGNFKAAVCNEILNDSFKGKDQFDFRPCAKMWFSCNELPTVSDKSDGFYRRIIILTMNHKPDKADPNLSKRLTSEKEMYYFLFHSFKAYAEALKRGTLTESETAKTAALKYRHSNDPIEAYMYESYETTNDKSDRVLRSQIYSGYVKYCAELGAKELNAKNFYETLRQKGYKETCVNGSRYFCYIRSKPATFDGEPATSQEDMKTAESLFPENVAS